ncbi:MAG: GntR family transcriptional regulator [Lachnospiraceae bacterium]|nr:GntR family transcriptional regulator [Lachnospiraceae bacterium]
MIIEARQGVEKGRDYATRVIRDNIVQLELEPGSMLSENELATALGISRTPVREALIDLAKVKIVEIMPQRGCRVALIDYAMVEEAFFLRDVMEEAIVELACDMATDDDIAVLEQNVKLQQFYVQNKISDKLFELDEAFHKGLFSLCNKSQIYEIIQSLSIHTERFRRMSLYVVKDIKTVNDHVDILEAIKRKDGTEAKSIMKKHLSRYQVDLQDVKDKYASYFKS